MTVDITSAHLATLVAAGTENNPVVGIDSIYDQAGSFTDGGSTASRAADLATYTYWTAEATADNLTYDLTTATACDMAGVASHDLGTQGASIMPQYWDGAAWQDLADAALSPSDDQTIVWLFASQSAGQFRFEITGATAAVSIGVAFFGRALTLDQRFYRGYDEARYPTEVELLANQSGPHTLGTSVIGKGSRVEWALEHLPEADVYSTDFASWVETFNAGKGFFSAWRPGDYGTSYYGLREGDPIRLPNSGPQKRKSLTFGMRVYDE